MSELRKLADDVERLFKEVCQIKKSPHLHIDSVKIELGKALSQLSWGAAEQEALSPAPQECKPGDITYVQSPGAIPAPPPKKSNVEYYKDRLVEAAINWRLCITNGTVSNLHLAVHNYKSALSASPDPEGEWQWVPKGFVVAPEEPNLDMLVFGERAEPIARNIYPSKIYKAMIAARPPVPKKGERA